LELAQVINVYSFVSRFAHPKLCLQQTEAIHVFTIAKAGTAIAVLFLLIYILPLGVRPMVMPDETRYAEISREMLDTGEWIVPKLDGLRYFEKPVLGHWLNAAAQCVFGENAFAVRFPSAMAAGFSVLVIFLFAGQCAGGASTGLLAAAIFLTCAEVFAIGVFCVLDSVFSMLITIALVAFYFAWTSDTSTRKNTFLVLFGVFCGLSFLTKGFLAFMLPFLVVIPFTAWERRWKDLPAFFTIPLVSSVLVALPWCIAIYFQEPDFWRYFIWTEHIERFIHANNGQHPEPFWFFIPILAGGALPWTPVFPLVIAGLKKTQSRDPFIRFLICWLVFPFIFFSACRGKLGTYILPCYPPLAILTAIGLAKYLASGKIQALYANLRNSAIFILVVAIALIVIQAAIPAWRIYGHGEAWKWVIIVIALSLYALLLIAARNVEGIQKTLAFWCLGPVFVMFVSQFDMPNRFANGKAPNEFLIHNLNRIKPDTILVSDNYMTPAVCWCYKRNDIFLIDRAGELEYGLNYKDSRQRLLDVDHFKKLIDEIGGNGLITLITSARRYDEYRRTLPSPIFEDAESGFVFAQFAAGNVQATNIQDALNTRL